MKAKKKTVMLASFALGALLFATTALADIVSKSGYDQLKDSLKLTAENCTEKYDSYTLDTSYAMKDNDKILLNQSDVQKHDRTKDAVERLQEGEAAGRGKIRYFSYSDKTTLIRQNFGDETYYVQDFAKNDVNPTLSNPNPFKEKQAEDLEKIADAVIGSLKDHVVVKENPDGSKELSGSLSEVQIPSLANAVASFMFKQRYGGNRDQMPNLTKDIYIKSVAGKEVVNKDGVMESLTGSVVLSGKDEQGQTHDLTIEFLGKITGINSTKVVKPDLTGKKVINDYANKYGPQMTNPEKYVGKFKNNIVIEKDGKFLKIGERVLEITRVDSKSVAGSYHEEYKQGYEADAAKSPAFKFESTFDNPLHAPITFTTKTGDTVHGDINFDMTSRIYFGMPDSTTKGDSIFNQVLD